MRLDVMERVMLGSMLAGHKDEFLILKQVREARETLSFNDIEGAKLKMVQLGDNVQWNQEAAEELSEVEIELADSICSIIKQTLQVMNDAKPPTLTDQHFTLYEKFVLDETK